MLSFKAKKSPRLLLLVQPDSLCFLGISISGELHAKIFRRTRSDDLSENDLATSCNFIHDFFGNQNPSIELIFSSYYLEKQPDAENYENLATHPLSKQTNSRTWIKKDLAIQIVRNLNGLGVRVARIDCIQTGVQKFSSSALAHLDLCVVLHLGADLSDLFVFESGATVIHEVIEIGSNVIISDVFASAGNLAGVESSSFSNNLRSLVFSRNRREDDFANASTAKFFTANGLSLDEIISARIRELCFFTGKSLLSYKGRLNGSFYLTGEGFLIPEVASLFTENLRIEVSGLATLLNKALARPLIFERPQISDPEIEAKLNGPIDALSFLLMSAM